MDPKMDQSFNLDTSKSDDELLSFGIENISFEILTKLLQALIIEETAFLHGASLFESVMQCKFMWYKSWKFLQQSSSQSSEDEDHINSFNILSLFCKSMIKSISYIFNGVLAGDIYEGNCYYLFFLSIEN